jgi:hypothetical protein
MKEFLSIAGPWMPLLGQIIVLAYVGEVIKKRFLTHEAARKSKLVRQLRKGLPLFPLIMGALWGLIPGMPVAPGFPEGWIGTVSQGLLAGVLSIVAYDIWKTWAKNRGYDPELVKQDSMMGLPKSRESPKENSEN